MPEGTVFSTQIRNIRQNYMIVKTVSFAKEELISPFEGEWITCQDLYNAYYDGTLYGKDPLNDPSVVILRTSADDRSLANRR